HPHRVPSGRSIMSRGPRLSAAFVLAACSALPTALADDVRELKPIATTKDRERSASIGPFLLKTDGVVIRSAEELVATTEKAKSAKDPAVQKEMEGELARLLKVERIDWGKEMALGVIGEGIESMKTDGKVLTVTFVPFKEPGPRGFPATPKVLVL